MGRTRERLVALARQIAEEHHAGQVDKAGEPYIGHPIRVAARVATPRQKAVALLHDVLEDTPVTVEDLLARGIPVDVVRSVERLTRPKDQPYPEFVRAIRDSGDDVAIAVKRADIADNSDEERLANVDVEKADALREKYRSAILILGADDPGVS